MLEDSTRDINVSSISIGDAVVEVSFFELRDQSERAGVIKSIVIERSIVKEETEELMNLLEDIVDKGLLEIRNPASSLDPRQRIGKKAQNEETPEEQ